LVINFFCKSEFLCKSLQYPQNNNNNICDKIYGAVIMAQSRCESSPGSLGECRLSARWLPTVRPSQMTWAVSPPVGCYHPRPPSQFYYYSAKADTHFTIPWKAEDLGTAVRVRSPCPRLYIAAAVAINVTILGEI